MHVRAAATRKFPEQRLPLYQVSELPLLGGDLTSCTHRPRIVLAIRSVEAVEGEAATLKVVDTLAAALGEADGSGEGMLRRVAPE